MAAFFIDTSTGRVATLRQLVAAGVVPPDSVPPRPWHPVRGDRDASTLWYAVMRKAVKGVYIGTLCIRHSDHHASLLNAGWQEVPVSELGEVSPGPWTDSTGSADAGPRGGRARPPGPAP